MMSHLSSPKQRPDAKELELKWREFAALQVELAERELDHETLRCSVERFEHEYLLRCGVRYLTLDVLNAEIAEQLARLDPEDERLAGRARRARERAERTKVHFRARERIGPHVPVAAPAELASLYRRLAKLFHPDLATDGAERAFRHDFMVELNACRARGDLDRMQQLSVEWEAQTRPRTGESTPDQLARVIRVNAQIRARITTLEAMNRELLQSDVGQLKQDVEAAATAGHDLIEELIHQFDDEIETLRRELAELRGAEGEA
jgi:hypothetical protein